MRSSRLPASSCGSRVCSRSIAIAGARRGVGWRCHRTAGATAVALPDLASRFAAATLLPLRPLGEAEQREALRLRAHARGLDLPEETALYLQRRFRVICRPSTSCSIRIDDAALQAQRRLTVPFIRACSARSRLSPEGYGKLRDSTAQRLRQGAFLLAQFCCTRPRARHRKECRAASRTQGALAVRQGRR